MRWNYDDPPSQGPWATLTVVLPTVVKLDLAAVAKSERRTMSAQAGIFLAQALAEAGAVARQAQDEAS
jgi:hypothetical protein